MEWIDSFLDDLEKPINAEFGKISFITSLVQTSVFDDERKAEIESEIKGDITNERANELLFLLFNNQQDIHQLGDYRQKSIHRHFDKWLGKL